MAGARTRGRGRALQALYAKDVQRAQEVGQEFLVLEEDEGAGETDSASVSFTNDLLATIREHAGEIDERVQRASRNWRLERMSTVDRNILRLATAELLYHESVPTKVVINEAIELAKRFGATESPAFVNGILDRIAQERGR